MAPHKVIVSNASKMAISEKKMAEKKYSQFSGYPGGLKMVSMPRMIEKKGYGEVLRNAVYGMIPANKLRKQIMKNLIISE